MKIAKMKEIQNYWSFNHYISTLAYLWKRKIDGIQQRITMNGHHKRSIWFFIYHKIIKDEVTFMLEIACLGKSSTTTKAINTL